MADEIYINTGSEIQQVYQGQRHIATAQEPNIRQVNKQALRNTQEPNIVDSRSPFTYAVQAQARQPTIKNNQSPFTLSNTGRTPFIYQHPTTYARQGQTPYIYQNQTPFTYRVPVSAQQPNIRNMQNAYPYIAAAQEPNIRNKQEPNIRDRQNAYPYIANSQEPNIRARQNAYPYIATAQEPNIRSRQNAYPYIANRQVAYPYIATAQEPNIRSRQNAYPYIATAQEPNIRDRQNAYPYIANRQVAYPYIATSQSPYIAVSQSPYIANGTRTVPDVTTIDATLVAFGSGHAEGGESANASANVQVEVAYRSVPNGGYLEVLSSEAATGNISATTANNHRRVFWFHNDHDVTVGGYTVRYTMTNLRTDCGENNDEDCNNGGFVFTAIGASATAIPTATTGNGLKLSYNSMASADAGSTDVIEGHFDINLIFEHATLPTYTYTAEWDVEATASADEEE